jgi:hypothetical protein
MSKRAFTSTNQVLEALGGNAAVAALTGRWPGAVSNWRSLEHFPANTYVIMRDALLALGHEAPPDWLWDMAPRAHRKPRRAKAVARKPVSIEAA